MVAVAMQPRPFQHSRPLRPVWIHSGRRHKLAGVTSGFSLLRKHRMRLAVWIAPALLFRALIPVGFMLEPVDGRADIILCASDAPTAMMHHGIHGHSGHHQHSHADLTCPYAQSAGPAPLPALPVLAAAPTAPVFLLQAQIQQTHARFGPIRQHSPRAPPRLA
jgi:Protein of unknown function (DUF2946)